MNRKLLWTTLLGACWWTPPTVTSATPSVAMPGDAFQIDGVDFQAEISVTLVRGELRVPVPVRQEGDTRLDGDLPTNLPDGVWTIEVKGRHGVATLAPQIDVWTAETEPPCDKRYALNTTPQRDNHSIQVDRIFSDRAATQILLTPDILAALTLTHSQTKAGTDCSALWAVLKDGSRVLLADDDTRDLAAFATPIAGALDLPLRAPGEVPPPVAPAPDIAPADSDPPVEAPAVEAP